jgi:superoxide reductase
MAKKLAEFLQEADWKTEKHVPVIECADQVSAGQPLIVKISLGKEVAHPNTTEHHIRWISAHFHPGDEKFIVHAGHFEFTAHGESVDGADKGSVYTDHEVTTSLRVSKPGTIYALAYCNIHGLWWSAKEIKVS